MSAGQEVFVVQFTPKWTTLEVDQVVGVAATVSGAIELIRDAMIARKEAGLSHEELPGRWNKTSYKGQDGNYDISIFRVMA